MREPVSGVVPETDHMTTIGGISSAVTSVWTATRNLDPRHFGDESQGDYPFTLAGKFRGSAAPILISPHPPWSLNTHETRAANRNK